MKCPRIPATFGVGGTAWVGPGAVARLAAAVSVGLVLGQGVVPPSARAFSDALAYADPVDFGGGAGRFFTGSRADGYACNACHTGGEPVPLRVSGLPVSGYVPGGSYEIAVGWPLGTEHFALMAEVTGPDGQAAGTLRVPRYDAMLEGELCTLERGSGAPAARIIDDTLIEPEILKGRHFVSVRDCGATYSRMLWTAPPARIPGVRFNLGFVVADNDADATGDGVTLIEQPLSPGSGDAATELVEGCSAAGASGGTSVVPLWVGLVLVLGRIAHRRSQRTKHDHA